MNTKIIIGITCAIIVAGGAFALFNRQGAAESGGSLESTSSVARGGEFHGSFAELSARGGEWKCTVNAQADTGGGQGISEGTVYVSGRNVRGDFTTTVAGFGTVQAHMIADGEYVYSWSSVTPRGIRSNMTALGSGSGATSGQGMSADQSYSYDCVPAQADASLFIPPTNISFTNI